MDNQLYFLDLKQNQKIFVKNTNNPFCDYMTHGNSVFRIQDTIYGENDQLHEVVVIDAEENELRLYPEGYNKIWFTEIPDSWSSTRR